MHRLLRIEADVIPEIMKIAKSIHRFSTDSFDLSEFLGNGNTLTLSCGFNNNLIFIHCDEARPRIYLSLKRIDMDFKVEEREYKEKYIRLFEKLPIYEQNEPDRIRHEYANIWSNRIIETTIVKGGTRDYINYDKLYDIIFNKIEYFQEWAKPYHEKKEYIRLYENLNDHIKKHQEWIDQFKEFKCPELEWHLQQRGKYIKQQFDLEKEWSEKYAFHENVPRI